MTYAQLLNYLTVLAEQAPSPYTLPTDFATIMPEVIEYAENRIYRDLVLLATRAQNATLTFVAGSRSLDLSAMSGNQIIVPEGVAAITPIATAPAAGTRIPFDEASLDVIDQMWPQESVTVAPATALANGWGLYWAMRDAQTIVVAPTPDSTYKAEITGLFRPTALSATNTTTYLSLTYPDVLVAACMIFVSGYMRSFGEQADDPKMAQSWEQQYTALKEGALAEEQRRRGQGTGWSQNMPTPLAQPPRT